MAYKCKICGANEVDNIGEICEECAIGQDPYAAAMNTQPTTPQSGNDVGANNTSSSYTHLGKGRSRNILIGGGNSVANTDPYGNDMTVQDDTPSSVQVYSAGQVPAAAPTAAPPQAPAKPKRNSSITTGITKNISVDNEKRSPIVKIWQSVVSGVPYSFDDSITMFQVFPDYTGTAVNAMGNACDQVIVYGKITAGTVSENNDVEVYGFRDSSNNVIATMIKNKASGTIITPSGTISAVVIRLLAVLILVIAAIVCMCLGATGVVWCIVAILCLTNLPLVFKIFGVMFGALFSIFRKW